MKGKIGIAITTRNRRESFEKSLTEIKRFNPNAYIAVVDDASDYDYVSSHTSETIFRFTKNVGIATAKNKCLELLIDAGCEHLFLFDDDTYPKAMGWEKKYIDSGMKHLSMTWATNANGQPNGHKSLGIERGCNVFDASCGCMLYIHRSVVEAIGGFDVNFPLWGGEHHEYSQRAFNAGLIPQKYMDVPKSTSLIHCQDYFQNIESTFTWQEKKVMNAEGKKRLKEKSKSKEYLEFRQVKRGIILACYLNSNTDPQRGTQWNNDISNVKALLDSCDNLGVECRIFHDCFLGVENDVRFVKVKPITDYTSYLIRWAIYREFLAKNKGQFDAVFCVDSTDVDLLKNPFLQIGSNTLYVGDEQGKFMNDKWLLNRVLRGEGFLRNLPNYTGMFENLKSETLLNMGILGGRTDMVNQFLNYASAIILKHCKGYNEANDMAICNYILWTFFKDKIYHGTRVNTKFKAFEANNKIAWFKHK